MGADRWIRGRTIRLSVRPSAGISGCCCRCIYGVWGDCWRNVDFGLVFEYNWEAVILCWKRIERGVCTMSVRERYVVDEKGTRIGVLLDIDEYRRLLEELEELAAIRAYDAAKASGDEAIPFEQDVYR